MYEVIVTFNDLQDEKYRYHEGDTYPRANYTPSEKRIDELATAKNRRKQPLIQKVEEEYPQHTGGGYYELSNGEKVQGKEQAHEAERQLSE